MKLTQNIEVTGTEIISAYFIPEAQKQGIKLEPKDIKVQVYSKSKEQFIDFDAKNVKFVWNNT